MPQQKKIAFGPRSTDAEIDRRIGQVIDVLGRKPTIRRSELRRIFAEDQKTRWVDKDGKPVCSRTVEAIASRARKEIDERAIRPKQDVIADILAGYERDLSDQNPKVRMAARLGIRQMRGLDEPTRVWGQHVVYAPKEPELQSANGHKQIDLSRLPPALLDQYEAVINAALALPEFAESTTHEPKIITLPDERQS